MPKPEPREKNSATKEKPETNFDTKEETTAWTNKNSLEPTQKGMMLRNIPVPGWGHLYGNRKSKGIALVGLWTGAIGFSVFTHIKYAADKDEYETAEENIEEKYDAYNKSYKMKNASYFVLGGVWAISMIDAAAFGPKSSRNYGLIYEPVENKVAFYYEF
jgi:hypothetical protein